jgi:ribosomal protein L23
MVLCGSYMFEFSVSKDMKKIMIKVEFQHIFNYLQTLIIKTLKIGVEQGRVVTTLNIIKH